MKQLCLALSSFALWLLLTWTLSAQNLIAGGIVAVMTALIFGHRLMEDPVKMIQPQRWFWMMVYIPVFVWEMTKANFDVAYRVIHPKMPIEPGIVKVKTRLRSDMGKTFLANSITLTPGTFTIDIRDEFLYIHCIKVPSTDLETASKQIVSRFENILVKIFD